MTVVRSLLYAAIFYSATALWVLAGISLVGAAVSLLRPAHVRAAESETVFEAAA